MSVAIRKRSWEEHVAHPSGLQYSYDDLDLVCCHGVDSEALWMGAEASKQGRRTRCASMPEGCHQLPTEDLAQTLEVTTSVVNDDTGSEQLKLLGSNVKVPLDLQEELVHRPHELVDVDVPERASESEHFQTASIGNSGEFHCTSRSRLSTINISCATDSSSRSHSEKTINGEGEVGTESSQSYDICNDDNAFKNPHISREHQQCISISSNNGPPLSESAGEQPGKLPNHQETKESHTEGYSRPPEIPEASLNQSSAAELEPQTDLPDVEETKISISNRADASVTLPVGGLHSSVNMMSQANKTVKPVVTLVVEEVCDKGVTESWSADSADKLDGLNDPETLNENTGLKHHSRDIQGREQDRHDCTGVLDQTHGCETSYQTLLEPHNVELTAMNWPQGEESCKKAAEVRYWPITSSDICFKGQCCSLTVNSCMPSEKLDTGYSEGDPIQTNVTQCADQYVETTTSVSQPMENIDESSMSKELACCEDHTIARQLENSCSKLDSIPEASHVEPYDTLVLDPQKSLDFTPNPDVQHSHINEKHAASVQHTENVPPYSAEVNDELPPQGLYGNQKAFGCYFSESPAAADGQREHHRPRVTVSRMEETDEAAHTVIYSDTQLASPVLDGTNEPEDQKEDNVVKVRMRKCEHARLDSMVLLLMKLDQLDQEIENALSVTSSMDSTPNLHRRQLEFDLGSVPAAHIPAASTSGPTPDLGAKPKSGSTSAVPEKEIAAEAHQWSTRSFHS